MTLRGRKQSSGTAAEAWGRRTQAPVVSSARPRPYPASAAAKIRWSCSYLLAD
jgi:hypothetical protein